jgi:hypothetical protein
MSQSNSQNKAWCGEPLDSMKSIYKAIAHLGLPQPSVGVLEIIAISSSEKKALKMALIECLQIGGVEPKKETIRFLKGLFYSVSNTTIQKVTAFLGYKNLPLKVFIRVGLDNGCAFVKAVNASTSPTDPGHSTSVNDVFEILRQVTLNIDYPFEYKAPPSQSNLTSKQSEINHNSSQSSKKLHVENTEDSSQNHGDEDLNRADFYSTHVYGSNAALCFNAVKQDDKGHYSVIVDGAMATTPNSQKYIWKQAIKFKLGHKELPRLYSVLVGWKNSIKLTHSTETDKYFEIERQNGKVTLPVKNVSLNYG